MAWSTERKIEAAIHAPRSRCVVRPDTQIIDRPGWHQVITPSAPGSAMNEIIISQLEEREAENAIDEATRLYHALGKPVKWSVGPWTRPEDFGARLERRGFTSWNVSGMGIDTRFEIPRPKDIRVRLVATDADLERYVVTMMRGWALPYDQKAAELDSFAAARAHPSRKLLLFVAEDEETTECIGTAAIQVVGDVGYLLGTQVLNVARGRGAYKALVSARLVSLRARGIEYAVTHARDATSAPILERLGFERLFQSSCWLLPPRS